MKIEERKSGDQGSFSIPRFKKRGGGRFEL